MNKKINYKRFRHIFNFWLNMQAEFKKDTIAILKEGPIDLTRFQFGQQPYHFASVDEDLYPQKAYLDENEIICVEATHLPEGYDKGYTLGWDDMCQDVTTLSDFADCVYDNADLQYETEMEQNLEQSGPCELLAQAEAVLFQLAKASADKGDHQDIVEFLSGCADNADKWMEVKRLVFDEDDPTDWDDAVEKVQPVFFPRERLQTKQDEIQTRISQIRVVYDKFAEEFRGLLTNAIIKNVLDLSPSGVLDLKEFHLEGVYNDPAAVLVEVSHITGDWAFEYVDTVTVRNNDVIIKTEYGQAQGKYMLTSELKTLYDELEHIRASQSNPEWGFIIKDGEIILKS